MLQQIMMESSIFEGEKVTKDVKNLFRLKKRNRWNHNQRYRNIFRLEKENKVIKDRTLLNIRNLLEHEEEYYYKPLRVANFSSNNYIEYESKGGRNKILLAGEYLGKIKSY